MGQQGLKAAVHFNIVGLVQNSWYIKTKSPPTIGYEEIPDQHSHFATATASSVMAQPLHLNQAPPGLSATPLIPCILALFLIIKHLGSPELGNNSLLQLSLIAPMIILFVYLPNHNALYFDQQLEQFGLMFLFFGTFHAFLGFH
jgi:hypothetical protein